MLSRREFTTAAVSGIALASTGFPAAIKAQRATTPPALRYGRLVPVRGTHLYVTSTGHSQVPNLVYIHGGPGTGSFDFEIYQRARLSRHLHLITFDQRGALRSDTLPQDKPPTLNDFVEDTEALRKQLGIRKWHLLAPSFAGLIATEYALRYPDAVQSIIFDNPTWNIGMSDRYQALAIAAEYNRLGKLDQAAKARQFAGQAFDGLNSFRAFNQLAGGLGMEARMRTFVHDRPGTYFMDWVKQSGLPISEWAKGGEATAAMWRSGEAFVDLRPRLKELKKPCLLIKGQYDFNTSPDQVQAFKDAHLGPVVTFEHSAHLTYFEEPERYAQVVERFVRTGKA